MDTASTIFDTGRVFSEGHERANREIPWTPHSKFPGVAMKTLISGQDCAGRFSTHLVRVESGCEIGAHVHETQIELHEVLAGAGRCQMGGREIAYAPGMSAVMSAGALHSVCAGEEGLVLKATFVPALS